MSAVFTALATSVDGFIPGPDPSPDQALGCAAVSWSVVPAPGVTHLHYDIQDHDVRK